MVKIEINDASWWAKRVALALKKEVIVTILKLFQQNKKIRKILTEIETKDSKIGSTLTKIRHVKIRIPWGSILYSFLRSSP